MAYAKSVSSSFSNCARFVSGMIGLSSAKSSSAPSTLSPESRCMSPSLRIIGTSPALMCKSDAPSATSRWNRRSIGRSEWGSMTGRGKATADRGEDFEAASASPLASGTFATPMSRTPLPPARAGPPSPCWRSSVMLGEPGAPGAGTRVTTVSPAQSDIETCTSLPAGAA
jgi:hypothetical protein